MEKVYGSTTEAHGWARVAEADEELNFQGSCIRYACHLDWWSGVEEDEGK